MKHIPLFLSVILAAGIVLSNLLAICLTGPYGWDDGAITVAYARTIADHGVFALTRASEDVEGTSSLLWTFLIALPERIHHFSFEHLILLSQLLTLTFWLLTLGLVASHLRAVLPDRSQRLFIVSLFGALPMFTAEMLNGMEMSLFAFLAAGFLIAFERRSNWLYAIIPLLTLARFEAVFYLVFSLALYFLIDRRERKHAALAASCAVGSFLAVGLFRWSFFHDFLPNTIWAKMNPPYSNGHGIGRMWGMLQGELDFAEVTFFLLVPVALSLGLRLNAPGCRAAPGRHLLGVLLIGSFATFVLLTGRNWGYKGRMYLACLPLLILTPAMILSATDAVVVKVNPLWQRISGAFGGRPALFGALLSCLLLTHVANGRLWSHNITTVMQGAHFQALLPEFLDSKVPDLGNAGATWITPANYRVTGLAVDGMRRVLGLPIITFLTPDVGGLALCCDNVRIVDSALLTNAFLARHGYGEFDRYISRVDPDVIETHGLWSEVSGIYDSGYFKAHYVPAVFENNLLWVNVKHKSRLLTSDALNKTRIDRHDGLAEVRYAGIPYFADIDKAYLERAADGELWRFALRSARPGL